MGYVTDNQQYIMKLQSLFLIPILLFFAQAKSQTPENDVKQVIMEAYVQGIHNGGAIEAIEKGFHPSFELLGIGQDGSTITKLPIYTWIENIRQARAAGRVSTVKIDCKFLSVDVTGNAANAKFELIREGKTIFTDYLMLYKFNEGWRIVGKIYFKH